MSILKKERLGNKMSTKKMPHYPSSRVISWSDYDEYTCDVPRQWHDVPLLSMNEEHAIISRLPSSPCTIIEVGAHNRVFSTQLSSTGYTVYTLIVTPKPMWTRTYGISYLPAKM
ncbi:MAG: hypothetical protein FJY86_02075 [Candidatus Diapherotrites archaeon]|uniref:Uncharacterized protein n=1 Tax=Candidatus Iainarchaeum sp. TaxID=3101447 RepID=A0A8T4C737_9ARCH|nr:hypothetical protein [Candidatus Diapherotrites archaeon]